MFGIIGLNWANTQERETAPRAEWDITALMVTLPDVGWFSDLQLEALHSNNLNIIPKT